MDKEFIHKNSIRDTVSQKTTKTEETRPFHLSLDTDKKGMVKCHIDGWMHIDEAKVLWQTIQKRNTCLELGTYHGLSTWIIAQANPECSITTVDIFSSNTNIAKNNCKDFSNINFVTDDSNDWLQNCGKKFDWVFVDHSHENFYMDKTLMCLRNCVLDDHIIVLHDMHLPGVQQQTFKFANFTRIRNLGIGTLW